eukprot:TRINITY_DN26166_c0_g1_i1.p1 TRINITY_DN26166_c0_g1~~TRINITY_DN26166_c0_g1_i1.p1  ORF type:complete len:765 (+),score=129.38 TRINITY_DN26166_c0_g1_i1:56-2296(+)
MGRCAQLAALSLLPTVALAEGKPGGEENCPCLGDAWNPSDTHPASIVDGKLQFTTAGEKYQYPLEYGRNCNTHDTGLPPLCDQAAKPEWCNEKWCYVDKSNCALFYAKSQFFPQENNLFYSYATCSAGQTSNSFEKWAGIDTSSASTAAGSTATGSSGSTEDLSLLGLMQSYLVSSRMQIEQANAKLGTIWEPCRHSKMCNCAECWEDPTWRAKIDYSDVGVHPPALSNEASCLADAIAFTYRRVAGKEANKERVGYQYFADQREGTYVQWPNAQFCPSNYDPRFRPWYASGVTGPKDVVIVVDVSGSMNQNSRNKLAKSATKAILDTLTWKDFATVILFNNDVAAVFSDRLVSVTDSQRDAMHAWVDSGSGEWKGGGTDFQRALLGGISGGYASQHPGAFKIIEDSVSAGSTSMCQKLIMFLTDGEADFGAPDFQKVRELSTKFDTVLFTYALGDGADTSITKQLACENRGIFYPVSDNDNRLATTMAGYYSYFAEGQQSCTPAFVEYKDAITKEPLYAGCLPMYDREGSEVHLLGVSCMDINMLASIESLKRREDFWRDTVAIASDVSKKCRPLDISECNLQKMRLKVGSSSVCSSGPSVTASTKCQCKDPTCNDDPDFIDEKGYFCDTWVGDDCDKAATDWGYSGPGAAAVKAKCRHSCGDCPFVTCTTTSCTTTSMPTQSRACKTDKVSGVDLTGCEMSCGDPSSSRYSANPVCNLAVSGAWSVPVFSVLGAVFARYLAWTA